MRQARPAGRGRRTIFLPVGSVFSVSGLPSSMWTRFPKAEKKYASPGPEGLEEREKKSIRGYGRCIDTCPRHRPLPALQASHIRHPPRTGKLGAS